jgi:hypothetical protein
MSDRARRKASTKTQYSINRINARAHTFAHIHTHTPNIHALVGFEPTITESEGAKTS